MLVYKLMNYRMKNTELLLLFITIYLYQLCKICYKYHWKLLINIIRSYLFILNITSNTSNSKLYIPEMKSYYYALYKSVCINSKELLTYLIQNFLYA